MSLLVGTIDGMFPLDNPTQPLIPVAEKFGGRTTWVGLGRDRLRPSPHHVSGLNA